MSSQKPKSKLKEFIDKNPTIKAVPTFQSIERDGSTVFECTIECSMEGETSFISKGINKVKKEAENEACEKILYEIDLRIKTKKEKAEYYEKFLHEKENAGIENWVGKLQELCAKNKIEEPKYVEDEERTGLFGNEDRFMWFCIVGEMREFGRGSTKAQAKRVAASKAFAKVSFSPPIIADMSVRQKVTAPIPSVAGASRMKTQNMLRSPQNMIPLIEKENKAGKQSKEVDVEELKRDGKNMIGIKGNLFYWPDIIKGKGATGKVFEGYFEVPVKRAAVKVFDREDLDNTKNKELEILRQGNHQNIVKYFITYEIGSTCYLAMELADMSLEDAVKSKKYTEYFKKFVTDATKGLVELHKTNIIHRDIKPNNILIFPIAGDIPVAKLADFGISRVLDPSATSVATEGSIGTRTYMPPEGFKNVELSGSGFKLNKKFDVFSLGLTIFFTITNGKHLFSKKEEDNSFEIQANIVKYEPNWEWVSDIEFTALKDLVKGMISEEPLQRPETSELLKHPFFWSPDEGLRFLIAVSNDLKNNKPGKDKENSNPAIAINDAYQNFWRDNPLEKDWKKRLCVELQRFMDYKDKMKSKNKVQGQLLQLKSYKVTSFRKLIEFIRDYHNHYEEWNQFEDGILKNERIFGPVGSKYGYYFIRTFPELTTLLYNVFKPEELHGLQVKSFFEEIENKSVTVKVI